jgi:hypothetical protein
MRLSFFGELPTRPTRYRVVVLTSLQRLNY